MRRFFVFGAPVVAWVFVLVTLVAAQGQRQTPPTAPARGGGWVLPPEAQTDKNPLTANEATLAAGKKLFTSKCQRCHGPAAKGDGPDGEEAHRADMDLTVAARAARNTDGVVFYKIWNGRETPKMPGQRDEMTKDQVWAVVTYVQTLRAK